MCVSLEGRAVAISLGMLVACILILWKESHKKVGERLPKL